MANEITVGASVEYEDADGSEASLAISGVIKSATTKRCTRIKQSVAITEVAIDLGGVAAPGYAIFINRDQTNFIDLRVGTAGAKFARLDPDTNGNGQGGVAMVKLGSGAQAPYAIADTAACLMDILICST